MTNKEPEEKDNLLGLINKLWSPIAGLIGGITLIYNFYKLWQGDQSTVTYLLVGSGLIFLFIALGWIGFSKKDVPKRGNRKILRSVPRYSLLYRRIAWLGLGIIIVLTALSVYFLVQHRTKQENKLIVLITAFEGPEDVYGLRNEIIENLSTDFLSDENIEIISIDEIVTVSKGSERARELGKNYLADIVIWGWYRPTENPNINIHIENLSPKQLLTLEESETFQPDTTISELEAFAFQQQTGYETSSLISFLAGYIEYNSENYRVAVKYFDVSLKTLPKSPLLFENRVEIYFYQGTSNLNLADYESAIQSYDQAIQLNPQVVEAYNNRGVAYVYLGEYERAIHDHDQAIQLNPQYVDAYNNRGVAYGYLGEYERAIQDHDQAIQLNPQYANAYNNRGIAYQNLGESELAIQNYDQAIQLNPQYVDAYINRGIAYRNLREYELAIQDYNQAIQINPQVAEAYNNRGVAYYVLEKYELAIQDYDQAIQINPQYANTYYNRGLAYQALGKTVEAEADFAKYKELTGKDKP